MALDPTFRRLGYDNRTSLSEQLVDRQDAKPGRFVAFLALLSILIYWAMSSPTALSMSLLVIALATTVWLTLKSDMVVFICKDRLGVLSLLSNRVFMWHQVAYVHLKPNALSLGMHTGGKETIRSDVNLQELHSKIASASKRGDIPPSVVIR